jgi:tRNA threonylcarbamoyladenosine biosynthesis protein TsaE
MKERLTISDIEAYDTLSEMILRACPEGAALLLQGPLGAGKSTFAARFSALLGYEQSASPSFGVLHEYGPDLIHCDLYRIGSEAFFERGLHESLLELPAGGFALIEWPDLRITNWLKEEGFECLKITLTPQVDNSREVEVVRA